MVSHSGVTAETNDEFTIIVSLGLSNISKAIFRRVLVRRVLASL